MPPFLIPAIEFVAPLFKKLDTWLLLLILLLAIAFNHARHRADAAESALAARPAVSDTAKKETDFHEEKGKVTIVERFLPAPPATAACPNPKPQLVERDTVREPSVIDRKTESESTHAEVPACLPAARERNRFVGVSTSPLNYRAVGVKAGMTVFRTIDLSIGYDIYGAGQDRLRLETAYRF